MEGADKVQKHRGERDTHGLRSQLPRVLPRASAWARAPLLGKILFGPAVSQGVSRPEGV